MPVLSMNEAAWDESNVMLSNGQEMSAGIRQQSGMARSQDDAMVGYFFQRPQTDVAQQYNSKRWAVGDDSVIEQVSTFIICSFHMRPHFLCGDFVLASVCRHHTRMFVCVSIVYRHGCLLYSHGPIHNAPMSWH